MVAGGRDRASPGVGRLCVCLHTIGVRWGIHRGLFLSVFNGFQAITGFRLLGLLGCHWQVGPGSLGEDTPQRTAMAGLFPWYPEITGYFTVIPWGTPWLT